MGVAKRNPSFVLFGVCMLMGCATLHPSYYFYFPYFVKPILPGHRAKFTNELKNGRSTDGFSVTYHPRLNHSRYAMVANSRMPPDLYHYATWQVVLTPESTGARTYTLPIQLSVVYSPFPLRGRCCVPIGQHSCQFPHYTSCLTPPAQTDSF